MNDTLELFFGHSSDKELTTLQMTMRGIAVFFIAVILVRIAGMRSFGRGTAFDITVSFLLGSILARTVTGESPFWPTIATATAMVILKRLVAQVAINRLWLEKLVKGEHRVLCKNGDINWSAMKRSGLSQHDLESGLRCVLHTNDLRAADEISIEPNGDITVVKKKTTVAA